MTKLKFHLHTITSHWIRIESQVNTGPDNGVWIILWVCHQHKVNLDPLLASRCTKQRFN